MGNDQNVRDLLFKEYKTLRNEMTLSKESQIKYLTFSATATAAIFGLAKGLSHATSLFYLMPLLILIPTWWIFFDRTTSMNRVVSYLRHLENEITDPGYIVNHAGWENSLAKFRENQNEEYGKLNKSGKWYEEFRIPRYLLLAYFTFFGLSCACVILYIGNGFRIIPLVVSIAIILIQSILTAITLFGLVKGKYSMQKDFEVWNAVLKPTKNK